MNCSIERKAQIYMAISSQGTHFHSDKFVESWILLQNRI